MVVFWLSRVKGCVIKTVSVSLLGVYCVCAYSETVGNTNQPLPTNIIKNPKDTNYSTAGYQTSVGDSNAIFGACLQNYMHL